MASILPAKVHAAAGQLEDALTTWRTGARPHQRTRAAGERSVELIGVIIDEMLRLRVEQQMQLAEYDREYRP